MKEAAPHADPWLWLTLPIGILTAIAAASGVFVGGLYRDSPTMVAQAIGQDAITLIVALPALVIAAVLSVRESLRARLVWLGVLVYLVYTYAGYAFAVRFNSLFLVYVALLGCALYALIGGLVRTDWERVRVGFGAWTPVKATSIFLAVIAILFYLIWLSDAVPAVLAGKPPRSLVETGTPTNFIHVLDMAWILPALLITAVKLWQRQPIGFALAAALLSFLALLALAILGMSVVMMRSGEPLVVPLVVIFAILFAASIGILIGHLRTLRTPGSSPKRGPATYAN